MEKKCQLVAWTKNISGKEDARLYMIPSLENEVKASLIDEIARIQNEEEKNSGYVSLGLARRAIKAYSRLSRFEIFAGHPGDGIRSLLIAAWYCTCDDVADWVYYDTDLGSYTYLCGELRPEFEILCEEAIALARKHGQEHVFLEDIPERVLKIYLEQTQEERDLGRHVREVSAWY